MYIYIYIHNIYTYIYIYIICVYLNIISWSKSGAEPARSRARSSEGMCPAERP